MNKMINELTNNEELIKKIVDLWYETQMGHYKKCQQKQFELSDLLWELREEIYDPMTGWANGDNENGKD